MSLCVRHNKKITYLLNWGIRSIGRFLLVAASATNSFLCPTLLAGQYRKDIRTLLTPALIMPPPKVSQFGGPNSTGVKPRLECLCWHEGTHAQADGHVENVMPAAADRMGGGSIRTPVDKNTKLTSSRAVKHGVYYNQVCVTGHPLTEYYAAAAAAAGHVSVQCANTIE